MPEIVNRERLANGCGPVALDDELVTYAEDHAVAQAEADDLFHGAGGYAELIASGYDTTVEVHDDWSKAEATRSIILDCSLTVIGVAAADSASGVRYWVEVFR